ncbi:PREDICTED: actin-binding LIM protein 1-like isoform X2 [Priapulus caudatus]|uniref:Actin-binding LIM protein 1-like isoform X2 n=1 Tax=Priapulus caudatus TaxID=37621 RepID=A0ABM1ENY9_PRICU|nr:PREDICTED: actin-binding LIM protein 1-like isoform X2 [Priapulus caudatus]
MGKVPCAACKKKCKGEVLKVQDKHYHIDCFRCKTCKKSLAAGGFFCKEGNYYCADDYQTQFGTRCAKCNDYVEGEVVTALGRTYHQNCLLCATCGKAFPPGEKVTFRDGKSMCENCLNRLPSPPVSPVREAPKGAKCAGCNKALQDGHAVLALDKHWHEDCFRCTSCNQILHGEYMGREGQPYCENDYQNLFGVHCAGCLQYITGRVLQAGDQHYHPECSCCGRCGEVFTEGQEMFLQGSEIWHPHCSSVKKPRGSIDHSGSERSFSRDSSPYNSLSRKYSTPQEPNKYEPKFDVDFGSKIYIESYMMPEPFEPFDRLKTTISAKPPKSPHFYRPEKLNFGSKGIYARLSGAPRTAMAVLADTCKETVARPRSPSMNNEEPINLAHFPGAHVPSGEEVAHPKIERDDWPAPPYAPVLLKRDGVDGKVEADDEDEVQEDPRIKKEEEMLSKINSGMSDIFLKDIKEKKAKMQQKPVKVDPRNASRVASAKKELPIPQRYESPVNASPSRVSDHPRPWLMDDASTFSRGTVYRSSMPGLIQQHGDPSPGRGMTSPKSATLPGNVRAAVLNDTRDTRSSHSAYSDSEADQVFTDGPERNGYDVYEKYPNAVHHRRSLPNIGSDPPKLYPYQDLVTSNKNKLADDIDRGHLEHHLAGEEFQKLFKMTPIEFYKLPLWKRHAVKKRLQLF